MRPMFTQCVSSGMCPPQCPPSVMPPGPNQGPPPGPGPGPGPGSGPGPGPGPGSDPFYPPPFSPYARRVNPYNTTDFRIYELNKRLQHKPEECDNVFWDNLVSDFFEDDATLTLVLCLEKGPQRFTIGRALIPRYFRSLHDGAYGLNRGHHVTKRTPVVKKRGPVKRVEFVRELVREVTGFAPYERRVLELLRNGLEKRAVKLAKRKLGTLRRGKAKFNELSDAVRKLREQRQKEAEAAHK